jgi:catechol 2,3-dioxygenase-like lactoylglutathione lyase family enzyme
MISRLTHVTVHVLDQERALSFYTEKLGCTIKVDVPMGAEGRWLAVCPPEQPDLELILSPVIKTMYSPETAKALRDLVVAGTFGVGLFTSKDIYATYEELSAKGVEFTKVPTREFYGLEAIFKDDSGNWFSLAQLTAAPF